MADKEVITLVFAKVLSHRVVSSRDNYQFKIFIGFYQSIGHLHGRSRIYIIVQFAYHQHQRTAQQMSIVYIGTSTVGFIYRISHPKFIPPDFIHTVVVTSTCRIGSLVEFRMEQHGPGRFLSSGRATENSYPVNIHIRIFLRSGFNPGYMVGQSGIFQVLVTNFFKFF